MEIEKMPDEFWEDRDWAFDNYPEWMRKYPDQWIAVVDKKVVAAGKDIGEIERIAREKTGRKYFPVIYVEGRVRIL
jgi:hypothetical protein